MTVGRPTLRLAALAVAAGLALFVAGPLAFSARPSRDDVGAFERALDPLRRALGPGSRVAVVLPTDDLAPWFVTQYALAPSTVVRVRAADCVRGSAPACATDATHLLLLTPSFEGAAAFGAPLGFVPAARSAGAVLLARRAP